eukprot:TRINITY_DN13646_c0_g1_i1.p1 TRINITY_DN13646_c0_g1~~TRINITY_DN13646_c0_g1_i1.p1  ORF type:complete len:344 (-),score=58.88 TRINITY_DN13646_c0_g1_i1:113-1144(-)
MRGGSYEEKKLVTSHDLVMLKPILRRNLYATIAQHKGLTNSRLVRKNDTLIRKKKLKTLNENELIESIGSRVNMKPNKEEYLSHLGVIHSIMTKQYKKFEPQNASASSSTCIEQKEKLFEQKPYEFIEEAPNIYFKSALNKNIAARRWKRNLRNSMKMHKLAQTFKESKYATLDRYSKGKGSSFDSPNYRYNDTISPLSELKRNDYYIKIETLINKCKESELELQEINVDKRKKKQVNKDLNSVSWAVREYLTGITGKTWTRTANIANLLAIRSANKQLKKLLFTPQLIDSIRTNMTRRAVAMSSLGQRTIWKPPRYVPSRQVVLASSLEELNSLYQVEGVYK